MSSPESEQVLTLLQELAALKEIEGGPEVRENEAARDGELCQKRRQEITEEIKALAQQKKRSGEQSPLSDNDNGPNTF